MSESPCIRVWTRDHVPDRYKRFATLHDDGEVQNTVFVAHIPAKVLEDRIYRQAEGLGEGESWGWWDGRGLFGTNSVDRFPDPDGDGVIVVGAWI